jgi:hypothetical protein
MRIKHMLVESLNKPTLRVLPVCTLVLGLLLVSCAGTTNSQAGAGEECVYVKVTGSNLPVKECRSAAEREAIAANNRQASDEYFQDALLLEETGGASLGADSLE